MTKPFTSVIFKFFLLAISISLVTACGSGGDSAPTTSGSTDQITNPKGTVVGNIQDTNGTLLPGVTVNVAGLTATTDMGGNYRFDNVGVLNAGDSESHAPLPETI